MCDCPFSLLINIKMLPYLSLSQRIFAKISFSLPFVSSLPSLNPAKENSLVIALRYIK